ncbi:MAG: MASE1 domain-containing protein [Thalassobaculum sp.]|uniref:ATP-binding protein n=1 Tax=Thalassobaculum sp. TaxID=2022740 RepID=UPI0032ECA80F
MRIAIAWPLWIAAYVALDYVSFIDSYRGLAITPWNPSAGLAVALVLLRGLPSAPVALVAPVLAGILVRGGMVPASVHLVEGLLFGGSYLIAGLLGRRSAALDTRLQTPRHTLLLMATALGASAMAAFSYDAVLILAGILEPDEIPDAFLRFFVGDLIGMLIVTPALLLLFHRRLPTPGWEVVAPIATMVLAFGAIFAVPHAREFQLFYLLFVPLLWFSFRDGIAGAAIALCLIQVGLIVAVSLRRDALADLVSFQMLMISLAATGLVFGSLIDQQRAAALRLRQQQMALGRALRLRSMGEVATSIAHQINQPITSIRTYAGLAREALQAGKLDDAADTIARIRAECDRAGSIVHSTRNLVRRETVQPRLVRVDELLADVRGLLVDRLGSVHLAVDLSPEARTVFCDPVQVEQALYNILDNAIDAVETTGLHGEVSVTVDSDGQTVEFTVADSGPGFAPGILDYGVTPLVTTKANGTGIGLSVARSVAEVHGGSLAITSGATGTIVRLRIAQIGLKTDEHGSTR